MKGKIPNIFGVVMALVLALSLVLVAVPAAPTSADPGTLRWSDITIPNEVRFQLNDGSDVGPIALSPDGRVIFAASGNTSDVYDMLMRSTDGGYTWKEVMTKLDDVSATYFPANIVDIVVSPSWEDDDTVLVATAVDVYISGDRGVTFTTMSDPAAGWAGITSIDVTMDEDGRLALLAGDSVDVYLMKWPLGGWVPQNLGADEWLTLYNVLDVAFAPGYATNDQIVCVAYGNDTVKGNATAVMTKSGTNNWGVNIADGWFYDQMGDPIYQNPFKASIGFPDDYNASPLSGKCVIFVGLSTEDTYPEGMGDVYRFSGMPYPAPESTVTDLNVRGVTGINPTETNIWSIAVSGNATDALIIAGTSVYNPYATPAVNLVYWSDDSGATWSGATKRPTGDALCYVAIGSSIAYAGTSGTDSAFSASTDNGVSWNGRGLIDNDIDYNGDIYDLAVSPAYAIDETLYLVTGGDSLWKSTDGGAKWERILASSLIYTSLESVNLVPGYPSPAPYVFVAGYDTIQLKDVVWRSYDAGTTFLTEMVPEADMFRAWTVAGPDTVWLGDDSGNVWWTTDGGTSWNKPDESDIADEWIHQIAISEGGDILVGVTDGTVHLSTDGGLTFEQLGDQVGTSYEYMQVSFDTNYEANNIVYAGGNEGSGLFRWNADAEEWELILEGPFEAYPEIYFYGVYYVSNYSNGGSIWSADDGTLYACGEWYDDVGESYTGVWRSVNPTEEDVSDIDWEAMDPWVWDDYNWVYAIRVAPGSNVLFAIDYYGDDDYSGKSYLWTYTDTLTGKVRLVSPACGSTAGTILEGRGEARVVLAWAAMTGAEEYEVQVALDEDFGTIVFESGPEGTVYSDVLWLGTPFYWRVRVVDPLMSQWSDTCSFVTPLGPGAARPTLMSPTSGTTGVCAQDIPLKPVFQWTGLVGSTNYEFQVSTNATFVGTVSGLDKTGVSRLGAVTAYTSTVTLSEGTNYFWRVRALTLNAAGEEVTASPWSDTGCFTTLTTPLPAAAEPVPVWVWVLIGIGAVLAIAVIVLTVRTRRPV